MSTTAEHTHCLRCRRVLHSAKSRALGYGPKCAAKVRRAAQTVDTTDYKAHQITSARELIEDGAIVPVDNATFISVSTDGTETYTTAPTGCTCKAGQKGTRCYHTLAAQMLLAA